MHYIPAGIVERKKERKKERKGERKKERKKEREKERKKERINMQFPFSRVFFQLLILWGRWSSKRKSRR